MNTLFALVFIAVVACAIARPPGPVQASQDESTVLSSLEIPHHRYLRNVMTPHFLPRYSGFEESPRMPRGRSLISTDWLNREIERINQMQEEEPPAPPRTEAPKWIGHDPFATNRMEPPEIPDRYHPYFGDLLPVPNRAFIFKPKPIPQPYPETSIPAAASLALPIQNPKEQMENKKKKFALTPSDSGYFELNENNTTSAESIAGGLHEGGGYQANFELEPRRQIRQNPNLRTKTLIAENLDKLKAGLGHEGHSQDDDVHESTAPDPANSIYGVAIICAIGTAITMALLGFAFAWYTLSKKAKAAADVDYPAYGVTGPTIDTSGDRKLAHSAHMYHYQHQKQQIIAMERNGMERNGSISEPESDEENEEGDYTVYECPGFATTGDMEVKNPLFNEEPTPATPGKCEVVKQQPKE